MKALKIILIVILFLFFFAGIALFVFIKTFDISRYKPAIIEQSSKALGRPVDFKTIDLDISLQKGIYFNLTQLVVQDEVRFQQGNLFQVENVSVSVDLLSYLTRRQVRVSVIRIDAPRISVVRLMDGTLNLQTLGQPQVNLPQEKGRQIPSPGDSPSSAAALPLVFIDDVTIANGTLIFRDRSVEPALSYQISQLDFKLEGFSLTEPFSFAMDAALLTEKRNIHVDGKAQIEVGKSQVKLLDVKCSTELADLPLNQLRLSVPVLQNAPFPEILTGKFQATIKQLTAGPQGLGPLAVDLEWTEGNLRIKNVTPGVSIAASQIGLKVSDFSLTDPFLFSLQAAYLGSQPNVSLEGICRLNLDQQSAIFKDLNISTDLSVLPLDRLKSTVTVLNEVPFPDRLGGKVQMKVKELSAGAAGLGKLLTDINWTGGAVSIKDVAPGISLEADQINLQVEDFSLEEPFKFNMQAAYASDRLNIDLKGTAQLNFDAQNAKLSNAKFTTDLANWSLGRLKSSLAPLKDVDLPESLQGKLNIQIERLEAGTAGLVSLTGKGELSDGKTKLPQLAVPVEAINAAFAATPAVFDLKNVSLLLGKGQVKAVARVEDYLGAQNFNADLDIQGVDLNQILDQTKQPVKVQGVVFGKFTARGQGLNPEKISQSLSGQGNLEMREGRLKDLNILKTILDKISILPDLARRVEENLPERYKKQLTQSDTVLNKVNAQAVIQNGSIVINPVELDADGFLFEGQGQVGLDQSFSIGGPVYIPEDLTLSMVQSVPELQYLLDESNRIMIPARVTGKGQDIAFGVDLEYLGRRLIQSRGKQELQKVLDKVFDRGQPSPAPEDGSSSQPQDPQAQDQTSPERKAIEGILDSIFGK